MKRDKSRFKGLTTLVPFQDVTHPNAVVHSNGHREPKSCEDNTRTVQKETFGKHVRDVMRDKVMLTKCVNKVCHPLIPETPELLIVFRLLKRILIGVIRTIRVDHTKIFKWVSPSKMGTLVPG